MTTAPGLIQSPRIICGLPTAATSTSASRQTPARSRVRECAIVTVALAPRRSCAIGRPTMMLRPTTTACAPASFDAGEREEAHAARGVPGTSAPGRPSARRPGVDRVEAVDVLGGVDAVEDALRVDLRRQRKLDEDAVDRPGRR